MRLQARKLRAFDKRDVLECIRDDASATQVPLPRQGILPHDLVHFIVESTLPFRHGFLSQVAEGASIAFDAGVSSTSGPGVHGVESGQVESIVEALQSQLWAGRFDLTAFHDGVALACASRELPTPPLPPVDFERLLFDRAVRLNVQWQRLAPQQTMRLEFDTAAGRCSSTS